MTGDSERYVGDLEQKVDGVTPAFVACVIFFNLLHTYLVGVVVVVLLQSLQISPLCLHNKSF